MKRLFVYLLVTTALATVGAPHLAPELAAAVTAYVVDEE